MKLTLLLKNDDFLNFVKELSELNNQNNSNLDTLKITKMSNGQTVEDNLVALIAKIGEKITIGKSKTFENSDGINNQEGLSPKAMMLSSLAGCSGIDIVDILKKMKIIDYDLKIVVEGELTPKHPKYYHTVHVNYFFSGADCHIKKCERAVELSVQKYCGVMEMFRRFAKIKTHIHFQSY